MHKICSSDVSKSPAGFDTSQVTSSRSCFGSYYSSFRMLRRVVNG